MTACTVARGHSHVCEIEGATPEQPTVADHMGGAAAANCISIMELIR